MKIKLIGPVGILLIIGLSSFGIAFSFMSQIVSSFEDLNFEKVLELENRIGGQVVHTDEPEILPSKYYYPNKNNYKLESGKMFKTYVSNTVVRNGNYFFSIDGTLRAIIYDFQSNLNGSSDDQISENLTSHFIHLEKDLIKNIGITDESVDNEKTQNGWRETSRRWNTNSKINAKLTLMESTKDDTQQLRLILYKD